MAILFSVLTSVAVAMSVMPSPVKVSDTTDVFHEITDIGKRVRQQVARSQTNQFGQPIQTNPPRGVERYAPCERNGQLVNRPAR